MNMLKGTISGGSLRMDDGTLWPLPAMAQRVKEGPAVYGVRPEHLQLDSGGIPPRCRWSSRRARKPRCLMRIGGQPVIGAFRERVSARPGDILPVRPDTALVHLFDQQSGARL